MHSIPLAVRLAASWLKWANLSQYKFLFQPFILTWMRAQSSHTVILNVKKVVIQKQMLCQDVKSVKIIYIRKEEYSAILREKGVFFQCNSIYFQHLFEVSLIPWTTSNSHICVTTIVAFHISMCILHDGLQSYQHLTNGVCKSNSFSPFSWRNTVPIIYVTDYVIC